VPAVLLEQVAQQPAQARVPAVRRGGVDQLVRAATGQRRAETDPGPADGVVPQRVEVLRRVPGRRGELPVVIVAGRGPLRAG
jgi:hypothetical protein